jgi:CheY-like chemotaxis protein
VDRARDAGLEVELRVEGQPRPVPPAIDLSVYRIVQEALTNAAKHAGRCRAVMSVRWRPGAVELEITNDAAPGPRDLIGSAGRGLIGMRERAGIGRRGARSRARRRRRVPGLVAPAAGAAAVTVRVLLADDQELVRAGLEMIIDSSDDLEVVGQAADGEQAVELARRLEPDVVLMDVRMPSMDGIDATRRIVSERRGDTPRVLMLTTFDLDEYVFGAFKAGASGFLVKDAPRSRSSRASPPSRPARHSPHPRSPAGSSNDSPIRPAQHPPNHRNWSSSPHARTRCSS